MFELICLVRIRSRVQQRVAETAAAPSRPAGLQITDRTSIAVAQPNGSINGPTCRCGRYTIEPRRTTVWAVDPLSGKLHSCEHFEILGRVTARELELWRCGLQSLCSDPGCSAFSSVETHNATLIPDDDQNQVTSAHEDPVR